MGRGLRAVSDRAGDLFPAWKGSIEGAIYLLTDGPKGSMLRLVPNAR